MSLVNLAHVCSHLQNASLRRLGTTSIPSTKLHLNLMLALQAQGFLSSVTRGTPNGPDPEFTETNNDNIAQRRIWVGLKYLDNEPVLSEMGLISKPKQRIWMGVEDLETLAKSRDCKYVKGARPGEAIFLGTDRGIFEIREAIERRIGGQLLCRAR
ncbi:ribosomal protein S8 [Ascobolus immersus RN42]|uniref:Ribosomal protein S8 n=1 Tax=Ascobolus immersus RN42 TaxID=1160509 RepID=A0A3N4IPN0_ASCIM|nr:ribosomal protein S8 [Ascobolus immersus RN42]